MSSCKVEDSKNLKWIEDRLGAGMSSRDIASRLFVKTGEKISHTSINTFKKNLYNTKGKAVEEDLKVQIKCLSNRIRGLELVAWNNAGTTRFGGFTTYSMSGARSHNILYRDIVEHSMQNTEGLEEEYKEKLASVKAKAIAAVGAPITDESFIVPRAESNKKTREAAEKNIEEADAAILTAERDRRRFRDQLANLYPE